MVHFEVIANTSFFQDALLASIAFVRLENVFTVCYVWLAPV